MKKYVSIIIGIIICVSLFTACDGKSVVFDAKSFVNVQLEGLNTKGKAYVGIYNGDFNDFVKEHQDNFKDTLMLNNFLKAIDSIECEAISKTTELSNGDEIKIKTVYDEKLLNEFKIKIANEEFTYTVSGLVEGTTLDPFAEIELVFEGTSPLARVEVYNRSEKQFIRDIEYRVEPRKDLRIGDKIVVTAQLDIKNTENNGFLVPDVLTKEYTVENIDEYVRDFGDIDKSANEKMKKEATDRIEAASANEYSTLIDSLLGLLKYKENALDKTKFDAPELTNIYLNTLKQGGSGDSQNDIFYVYKVSAYYDTETEPRTVYTAIRFKDAIKKADGSTEIDTVYTSSWFSPIIYSIGETFDGVYREVVTAQKASYEIQEITP